ncbi:dipeptidase [Rubrivirga sp.]|uniref:dipeptidase n=1 Tax=Rubrivirga sp. TaxID=1885344 RepID=UPI003C7430C6
MSTLFAVLAAAFLVGAVLACSDLDPAVPAADLEGRSASAAADLAPSDTLDLTSDGGAIAMPSRDVERLVASDSLWAEALRIHYDALVLDGHVDTPSLMVNRGYRITERHRRDHLDLPRMADGGLDGAFFAAYVARSYGEGQEATDRALELIEETKRQVSETDDAEIATSAADVRAARARGRAAILLGLEGGHALQGSVDVLRVLAGNGIRYVTLTHTNTNAFADASTDVARWGGLNDLGRELVREMNRLGVLVDLSHVSDAAAFDALEATRAPVILSHSSCRALYGHVRNAPDDVLEAVAENGGAVMINFYDTYIGEGQVDLEDVLDHVDHAVRVAGVDHVGLGSDFDGVPSLPAGLEDVTRLPWITYGLLQRGYSETAIRKILGGNTIRVLEAADHVASRYRDLEVEPIPTRPPTDR